MWLIFNKSFQKNLTEVLKFDTKESRTITAAAKKKYKELIDKLPELEKKDRFKMNIVSCAMMSACQRAQAIVSDFSHNGCGNYGENIALNSAGSAYRIHMQWFYSTGHHNNYMLSSYVKGACAIYVYQGVWYAVENFALEESENSDGTLSCNAYGPEAEAALNEYIDSHDW